MGILGDAEAWLKASDVRRAGPDLALIELHRAEARLREAAGMSVILRNGRPMSFTILCRQLGKVRLRSLWHEQGKSLRNEYRSVSDGPVLTQINALARDAMRFLDRAEPVLRERRRNVWWTTWFFERKLRAIAMRIWATVFEKNTPIPYVGLEASMRKSETIADVLLTDAIRMIRVDVYRLATIIDAYASSAKALQVRLLLDSQAERLPYRRELMMTKLRDACEELERVRKRRTGQSRGSNNALLDLDKPVLEYVAIVEADVREFIGELTHPMVAPNKLRSA